MESNEKKEQNRHAGYTALVERFQLDAIHNWHRSSVSNTSPRQTYLPDGTVDEVFPSAYWPGDTLGAQLEFALKYDGVNLALLNQIFSEDVDQELVDYIKSKPTGKYVRRIWFFFEFLTGRTLPLEDLDRGNYVELLDSEDYYITNPSRPVRRQRVYNNLLGGRDFCPIVRRTPRLNAFESANLSERCRMAMEDYPQELLNRALSFLYLKETQSSFDIEHEKLSAKRMERFYALLHLDGKEDFCREHRLLELQRRTVDPRYRAARYRDSQNYVAESLDWEKSRIHFISPKPADLPALMGGLIAAHERMANGNVPAVIHAAAIAFGFVFLHPFDDGNGRVHRFLIHNILSRRGFTPTGVIIPVSASMLQDRRAYDASLEAFSERLMPLIDYRLDQKGRMSVDNDTAGWYRYIDMTAQAEALYEFIQRAIDTELPNELTFLARYDETKRALMEIVDMPDRHIDLFIRFCRQNNGRLGVKKRAEYFELLTDEEVNLMEQAVRRTFALGEPGKPA